MIEADNRIVFIEPPVRDRRHIPERFAGCTYMLYPLPDLANFYMLSYLEKHGFQTEIVNAVLDDLSEEEFIKTIQSLNPRALILHSVILAKALDLAILPKILAAVDAPIFLHGPEPSRVPREYIEGAGDLAKNERLLVFIGEPEKSILRYLQDGVKTGVVFHDGREIITIPHDHQFISIEELPFDFHHHPTVKRLSQHFLNAKFPQQPVATMLASRGCPFPCSYCVPNSVSFARELEFRGDNFGPKPRAVYASPERVIAEFKAVKEAGYPSLMVMDDQFLAQKKRTLAICDGVKDLGLQWGCLSRPDFLDDEEVVQALARAGCISIDIGVETLSQHLLDLIDKRLDVQTFYRAVPLLQKHRIEPKINIMFGASAEETENDIMHTIRELERLKVHHVMFAVATPFKGTPFYEQSRRNGTLVNDSDAINPFGKSMISYPHLSQERLQELCRYAYRRFYLRPSQMWRRLKSYRSLSSIQNDLRVISNLFFRDQTRRSAISEAKD
ncbi:MAG: B12-binding domain-containing radical SAM protein [Candidatus Hinthialibacter sp.]